jgi:hypothetical protein
MDDLPEGTVDLAALEAAGAIEIHAPGTPAADAFHRDRLAQLAAVDAELVARDGPEAMTSDRLLRQAALTAEHDPAFVGHRLAACCRSRGWERSDLASWLGLTIDQLAALSIESTPGSPNPGGTPHASTLAARFGADPARLAAVLGGGS